jgi:hypothetical protein
MGISNITVILGTRGCWRQGKRAKLRSKQAGEIKTRADIGVGSQEERIGQMVEEEGGQDGSSTYCVVGLPREWRSRNTAS